MLINYTYCRQGDSDFQVVAEESPEKVDLTMDDDDIKMRGSINPDVLTQVCTIAETVSKTFK